MELLKRVNWVDVVVVILLLRTCYASKHHSLTEQIFSFLALALNITLTLRYYPRLGGILAGYLPGIPILLADFLGALILMAGIGLASKAVLFILGKAVKVEWSPFIEGTLGYLVGLANGALIAILVLILLTLAPAPYLQRSIRDRSITGPFFLKMAPLLYEKSTRLLKRGKGQGEAVDKEAIFKSLASDKSLVEPEKKKE